MRDVGFSPLTRRVHCWVGPEHEELAAREEFAAIIPRLSPRVRLRVPTASAAAWARTEDTRQAAASQPPYPAPSQARQWN